MTKKIIVKVTKFAILDDEHKESFESSLFRDRKPPHNSQAKISLQSIHPFHENENRQRGRPDALLDRELCGTEAFFFIFLETAGMGVIYKTPCDSNS